MDKLSALESSGKIMLTPAEIGKLIGAKPQSIRTQAQQDPKKLGFPVTVIGTRVLAPTEGFIKWMRGESEASIYDKPQ